MRGTRGAWGLLALAAALACSSPPPMVDAGCLDAGANTVCGGPEAFKVRFAGLVFPEVDDGGNPLPNVLDVILADKDLSGACGGDPSKLVAFTGVKIEVNGYFLAVDAGTYTAPTASVYEISWAPDAGSAGTAVLGASDNASVLLTDVNAQKSAAGYFTAELALPATELTTLYGNFTAQNCQGVLAALCGQYFATPSCPW